jgi:Kef-type K+ transport system membrane component KefB
VLLVGVGAWLLTGRVEVALMVGTIAGTTGLATVISTLKESGARGDYARLVGVTTASDNFLAIFAFSLLLPLAVGLETGSSIGGLYADRLVEIAASIGIGFVAGVVISRLIKQVSSSHELSMLVLAHVLVVVGVTEYLGYSILLAGLAMGATAANLTRAARDRERAFAALISIEFPVIAIFFLWAGANLHIRALGSIGALFGVYVGARVIGKLAGPLVTAWAVRKDSTESRRFVGLGMSLLPQAGAAVGLGILAQERLPESGETILAAVLAAVVVFELVGPLGVHWAAKHVGEAKKAPDDQPLTLPEAINALQTRRARVAVLVGLEAEATVLRTPRILGLRLGADLIVVPVTEDPLADSKASIWGQLPEQEAENGCDDDGSSITGCREVVLDTVLVVNRSPDRLISVLAEHAPDLILFARESLPACVVGIGPELSRRLFCPVLDIPVPEPASERRLTVAERAAEVLERTRALLPSRKGTGSLRDRLRLRNTQPGAAEPKNAQPVALEPKNAQPVALEPKNAQPVAAETSDPAQAGKEA